MYSCPGVTEENDLLGEAIYIEDIHFRIFMYISEDFKIIWLSKLYYIHHIEETTTPHIKKATKRIF